MADERKKASLAEVYEFGSGLSKPRSAFGSGYPFLSFKDIFYNSSVPAPLEQLVNSTEKERAQCSVKRGDVFLTRTSETMDELGMSCVALCDVRNATFNGFTKRLRPKDPDAVVPEYARYYFRSPMFRRAVTAMSSLSTRASLNNEMLARLSILLPPPEEQAEIGHILGTLDDKIELNRRMNETLEAMACALFKSWFVDFDPVRAKMAGRDPGLPKHIANLFPDRLVDSELGAIPEGWQLSSILERAELLSGGTPKTDIADYWGGEIRWATAKDVSQCGDGFLITTERYITQRGLDESSTQMIPAFSTVVVARGATTGRLTMLGEAMAMNQTCYALRTTCGAPLALYCSAKAYMDRMVHAAHGSVFDTITTKTFQSTKVLLPPEPAHLAFDQTVKPMFMRLLASLRESAALAELRDALLPKLLSGEIGIASDGMSC